LLLAPLGGLIGAILLAVPMVQMIGNGLSSASLLSYFLLSGVTFGALLAAPTTLVALPVASFFVDQYRRVPVLAAAGFASGATTMLLIVLLTLKAEEAIHWGRALGVMAVGGTAGAVCGAVLGRVTRRSQD
jgi:MFS family permease